jgi:hypothetical protein
MTRAITAFAAAGVLAMAGCGGDDDQASQSTSTPASPTTTETTTTETTPTTDTAETTPPASGQGVKAIADQVETCLKQAGVETSQELSVDREKQAKDAGAAVIEASSTDGSSIYGDIWVFEDEAAAQSGKADVQGIADDDPYSGYAHVSQTGNLVLAFTDRGEQQATDKAAGCASS